MTYPEALTGPYTALDVRLDQGVAVILLANPPVNALSTEMMLELSWVLDRISETPEVRAVVLSGQGRNFCAGADLAWMQHAAQLDFNTNLDDARELAELMYSLGKLKLPTLAVVRARPLAAAWG